ncbi:hypothetical protein [Nostoc sp. KVJ3]|uniref:hypothetical protein n=1 Tax=Nostoc sp. KVJ3 TaxID=457945 RepID=UPI002238F045|nr:hypothetical protein [Nostoc sp. KVJ3]
MLVRKRNEDPHSVSPFLHEGLAQTPQSTKQHQQPEQLPPLQKITEVEHLDVLVMLVKLSLAVV